MTPRHTCATVIRKNTNSNRVITPIDLLSAAQPVTGAKSLHASRQLLKAAASAPHSGRRSVLALGAAMRTPESN
jgi:hypothetical protein